MNATLTDTETAEAYRLHRDLSAQGDPYALTKTIEHFLDRRAPQGEPAPGCHPRCGWKEPSTLTSCPPSDLSPWKEV